MISHEIIGDDMQAVVVTLAAGDEIRAEAGAMTYMTDGIDMDARMEGGILGGTFVATKTSGPPDPRDRQALSASPSSVSLLPSP